jgi:hypothetical protein
MNFRRAGFIRQLQIAQPIIHLIHEFRLLIKVPTAVLADAHLIAYTQYIQVSPIATCYNFCLGGNTV